MKPSFNRNAKVHSHGWPFDVSAVDLQLLYGQFNLTLDVINA
jgi:hypothetical protein